MTAGIWPRKCFPWKEEHVIKAVEWTLWNHLNDLDFTDDLILVTCSYQGCSPLCQTDRSQISGNTPRIFRLNRANQYIGMALIIFSFPNSLIQQGKEPVCQKWNCEFRPEYSRNKWTTSRGGPEYSGQKKPKRTLPFEFRPKFLGVIKHTKRWRSYQT